MKIVEAISDTNIGGAGILLLTRLKYTDRHAYPTTVLVPQGSKLMPRLRALGVPVTEIHGCRDRSLEWRTIGEYRSVLMRLKPDLVNCHGCLSCRIAAKWCGVPITVYTRHCAYPLSPWQTKKPTQMLLGAFQQWLSDGMIAVADAAKQNLTDMGVSHHRICVIVNGAEAVSRLTQTERMRIRLALHFPANAFVIGICARLEPCKGHRDFLRAAQKLLQISSGYRFLIVGGGSMESELKQLCRDMGISSYVHFTGFAEDVIPYWNVMDCHVNCSLGTETSSLALSEAMSLGIPSVVSDYGGNPYMVRHGVNGLVYPVGRYDILARLLYRLSSDTVQYRLLSRGAEERFQRELNAERMTRQTETLYRKLYEHRHHIANNIGS